MSNTRTIVFEHVVMIHDLNRRLSFVYLIEFLCLWILQHWNHTRADNVLSLHRFFALKLSTFHRLHISNSREPPQHQNSAQKSVSFPGKPREMYFPTSRLWAVRERSELFFYLAFELRRRGNECSAPPSFGFLCLRTRWKIFWVFFSTFFLLQTRVKRFSFSRVQFFHCATLHSPARADFVPPTFHPCHELYSHCQSDATGGSEQQNMENFRLLYESPTESSRKKKTPTTTS